MYLFLQVIESVGSIATVITLWVTLQRFHKDSREKESETLELTMNRFFTADDVRELLKIRDSSLTEAELAQLSSAVMLLYRLRDLNQKIRNSVQYDEENSDLKDRQNLVAELLAALSPERIDFLKNNYPDVAFLIDELHPDNSLAMEDIDEATDTELEKVEATDQEVQVAESPEVAQPTVNTDKPFVQSPIGRNPDVRKIAKELRHLDHQAWPFKAADDVRQVFLDAGVGEEAFKKALNYNQILIVKVTGKEKGSLGDWRISPNRAEHIKYILSLKGVDNFYELYQIDEHRKFDILPSGRLAFHGRKLNVHAGRQLSSLADWDARNPVLYYKVWTLRQNPEVREAMKQWRQAKDNRQRQQANR